MELTRNACSWIIDAVLKGGSDRDRKIKQGYIEVMKRQTYQVCGG